MCFYAKIINYQHSSWIKYWVLLSLLYEEILYMPENLINFLQNSTNMAYVDWMPTTSEVAGQPFLDTKKATKRKLDAKDELLPNSHLFFGRDDTNPPELNEFFKPFFCELCNAHLNSLKSAKIHYESKVHDKHVTNWIMRNYIEKNLPPPKIKRFFNQTSSNTDSFHCDLCDLPLTSLVHAQQHFDGKRHKLVLKKQSKPSGAGYYNEEGKWIRTGTKANPLLVDNRFGLGESSKTEVSSTTTDIAQPIENVTPPENSNTTTTCTVCNVTVTSPSQMIMHLQGAKHYKKLRDIGIAANNNQDDTIMANLYKEAPPTDLSIYRTPSGCYYCKICNITVTDESSLKAHLVGKKHIKAAASEIENNKNRK